MEKVFSVLILNYDPSSYELINYSSKLFKNKKDAENHIKEHNYNVYLEDMWFNQGTPVTFEKFKIKKFNTYEYIIDELEINE